MTGNVYPKFRNDRAVPEIRIGVKEFNCIGVSPPHDHPHIYLNMGEEDTIICPLSLPKTPSGMKIARLDSKSNLKGLIPGRDSDEIARNSVESWRLSVLLD